MDKKKYFKSTEKTFWKKTVGREWTNYGIRGWLLKVAVIFYFIQFVYFDFDWKVPFVEGFIFYVFVFVGYIFLSKDNKNYFYLRVSKNTIEVFNNNTIQQEILTSDLMYMYIFDNTKTNISWKETLVKNNFKWTGVSFQWVKKGEENKSIRTMSFYLDNDEIVKLKNFINTDDLLKSKLRII